MPALTPELYSQVHRTGERLPFERVYQERRRRLARSAIRLLLQPGTRPEGGPTGVWWEQLLEAINALLAEPSWAWPAHVNDPSGIDRQVIDLFAAETANLCGELVSLFGPWLPAGWIGRLQHRVLEEMVEPFLQDPEAHGWTAWSNNWNAVCHQGLMGASLALGLAQERLERLLEVCRLHLERFLDGFSPAGTCLEGITYWDYGFGWFALLNEQLELASGGRWSLVADREERIRAIARFGPAMLLQAGQLVNIADSRLDMPPRASLLMLLGRRLQLPECTMAGKKLYRQLLEQGVELHGQRCDLLYLTRMLLEAPTAEEMAPGEQHPPQADWIDRDAGLVVVRRLDGLGRCWELVVKGGHNGEPHNHNDCGSFLLQVDGQWLAIELGAPEYTADTFGPRRYTLLATRSGGHSLPLVNGWEQEAGQNHGADLLELELGANSVRILMDLTRAYPGAAGHQRLLRRITFQSEKAHVGVEDTLWADGGMGLESVLITATDRADALGLEADPGTTLHRVEPIRFRDNRGVEVGAWRWIFRPIPAADPNRALAIRAGYRIHAAAKKESAWPPFTASCPQP